MLLLADVFENFGNKSWKNYELCPCHSLSAPCISWDLMPKTTKFEFDFIPDPQMLIIFEKGTGSGIFHISNRYKILQNKTRIKTYNILRPQ